MTDRAEGAVPDSVALTFLNDEEARAVEAIAERIIPGEGQDAGATEAGVVYYIDRSLAGISADLQVPYRLGLRALEELCQREHGRSFALLAAEAQDALVRRFLGPEVGGAPDGLLFSEADQAVGPDLPVIGRLFTVVREHTVEGYFCDPVYGGNRGTVGWKLVGFPGAHWGYTAEQMAPGFDGRSIPIKTLSDLRRELQDLPPNEVFYRNERGGARASQQA
jgi:gluconate 2-dehydrogenase gamma chain